MRRFECGARVFGQNLVETSLTRCFVGMANIYKLFALRRSLPVLEVGLIQSADGLASQKIASLKKLEGKDHPYFFLSQCLFPPSGQALYTVPVINSHYELNDHKEHMKMSYPCDKC